MAQTSSPYPYLTVEEYFELEETAPERHEFVSGQLYALAGATDRHNEIILNIATRIHPILRGTPCRVYTENMRLRVTHNIYYYPDLMVTCNLDDRDRIIRHSPCLVVEVMSPSSVLIDRREKLFAYRQIDSLQAYVMVYQDQVRVERHFRGPDGEWRNAEVSRVGNVPLPCPEITLTLDDIYAGVDLSG